MTKASVSRLINSTAMPPERRKELQSELDKAEDSASLLKVYNSARRQAGVKSFQTK